MKELLLALAFEVRRAVNGSQGVLKNRLVGGHAPGGDAQFHIDEVAERAVDAFIERRAEPVAIYTEGRGLRVFGKDPACLLIVDPIDGTRPAAAGFPMACVSIAAARFSESATIDDVEHALLCELASGAYLYADRGREGLIHEGYGRSLPNLSSTTELDVMFWALEFNGHPARRMIDAYGHIIDRSANPGGVFVFNSASFAISRIITGQLDAYVDIGNRLLRDEPALRADFERAGHGSVLHLFPYDIAASVLLAEKAGVIITDAYGEPLGGTRLLGIGPEEQQSCIAASNGALHRELLQSIRFPQKA